MVVRFTMTWDRVLTSEKEGLSVPVPGFSVLHATSWILETGPSERAIAPIFEDFGFRGSVFS